MTTPAAIARSNTSELHRALEQALTPGTVLRLNEPLSRRTTLRVGGPADLYVEPASEAELAIVLGIAAEYEVPFMMLGRGSNLLVRDGGIRGIVICLAHPGFSTIHIEGDRIHCGAGARMRSVAFETKKASLAGLEFMEGIPGNVGGGLRMNAGAMGSSMFQVLETLRYMTPGGEIVEEQASDIAVEYRACPMLRENVALRAVLKGESAPREAVEQRLNECSQKRWNSQPAAPSAGCIFKNPVTVSAGLLVQELGLKGTRRGGAVISEVHGNFIVNEGNATARDILGLIELVKARAMAERSVELHTEVQIVGEDPDQD